MSTKANLSLIAGCAFLYSISSAAAYTSLQVEKNNQPNRAPVPQRQNYPVQGDPFILSRRDRLTRKPEQEDSLFHDDLYLFNGKDLSSQIRPEEIPYFIRLMNIPAPRHTKIF